MRVSHVIKMLPLLMMMGSLFSSANDANSPTHLYSVIIMADLDDESSQTAKKKSIEASSKEAWYILLRRLLKKDQEKALKAITEENWSDFLESVQIHNERASSTRYRATLVYHFNEQKLRALLQKNGTTPATAWGDTILIIPFYQKAGEFFYGLGEKTPWGNTWDRDNLRHIGLLRFKVPSPSQVVEDPPSLKALIGNKKALLDLAQKYNADEIMILLLQEDGTSVSVYPNALEKPKHFETFPIQEEKKLTSQIKEFLREYDAQWKEKEIPDPIEMHIFRETYPVKSFSDQQRLIKEIKALNGIEEVNILNESCEKLALEIKGSVSQEWVKEKVAKNQQKWNT